MLFPIIPKNKRKQMNLDQRVKSSCKDKTVHVRSFRFTRPAAVKKGHT